MKKAFIISSLFLIPFISTATIHVVKVWDGYFQFTPLDITIQLGDTIQWLPLDVPSVVHTITSTNIPAGAATFDQVWQAPVDTFFQYVPLIAGLYEYECTPHAEAFNMVGSFDVIDGTTSINVNKTRENKFLIYPNPATNSIRFIETNANSTYKIFDSTGRLVLSGKVEDEVAILALKSGLYFIEILGDRSLIEKFIKQ